MSEIMSNLTEKTMQQFGCDDGILEPGLFWKAKEATPARIGIGHAGARCKTDSMLRFLADHAQASDSVFMEVDEDIIKKLGIFEIHTRCRNKEDMILRPDWGRIIEEDQQMLLKQNCISNPKVQIYFGDGLCSPAIAANIPDLYKVISSGLDFEGITVGTPFFVRYCRVNTARIIGPLLGAEVTCVLIGERPGLTTAESMSAYIAYKPHPLMLESEYTVVSNISRFGIPPVEAAAHIVDLIIEILEKKQSGIHIDY